MINDDLNNESVKKRILPSPRPTLPSIINQLKNRSHLVRVDDTTLYEGIESIIENNSKILRGEYSFYCVYQKTEGNLARYALIHAFYLEADGINQKDMDRIILEDGKIMHQSLLESKLECDYFYVLPYFDYADRSKGSILLNNRILLTNELQQFEDQLVQDGL